MKSLIHIFLVALLTGSTLAQTAKVQLIHNTADFGVEVLDVYVESVLAADNITFRNASAFVDLPADIEIDIAIALGNSASANEAFYTLPVTLSEGETYIAILIGIQSPVGYNPSPPFQLRIYDMGREVASNPANVDVLVHHGTTDGPTIDIVETGVGLGTLIDDISYTQYQGYLELPTDDYIIQVMSADGNTGIAAYQAPLATLGLSGAAMTVLASGFLNPAQNVDGPPFGLWVASPLGGPLLELPGAPLSVAEYNSEEIGLYPNPANNVVSLDLKGAALETYSVSIMDISGRVVDSSNYILSTNSIDVSKLTSGIYTISLMDGSSLLATIKLVKE